MMHKSRAWLTKKYQDDKLSIPEIAKLCGVTQQTIYTYLKKFGLK